MSTQIEPPVRTTAARWPEIDVVVRCGRLVPRWIASSEHPEVGAVSGRGISRAAAVRSLVRELRRTQASQNGALPPP